jgi:hypothetical protein
MMNLAMGLLFLVLLAPMVTSFTGQPWYVQAAFVLFGLPFVLVALLCLTSAARPGSLGRGLRRLRSRRSR